MANAFDDWPVRFQKIEAVVSIQQRPEIPEESSLLIRQAVDKYH
jgi:hypothetical protein